MNKQLSMLKAALCWLLLCMSYTATVAQVPQLPPNFNPQIQLPDLPVEPFCAGSKIQLVAPFTGFLPNFALSFDITLQLEGSVSATTIATLGALSNQLGNGQVVGEVTVPNVPGGTYLLNINTVITIPPIAGFPPVPPIPVQASGIPVNITQTPAPNFTSQSVVQNTALALTASNCAGTLSWTGPGSTSGTESIPVNTAQTGEFNYSATCTVNGCASQPTNFVITVTAPQNTAFKLVAPTYNCQTGEFTYNTEGGDGSQIEYYTVPGITGWTTQRTHSLDRELRTSPDAETLILKARQNGVEVQLAWNVRDVCPIGENFPGNQAPSVLAGIPNQRIYKGQPYSYTIPENAFRDPFPDGEPLTFSISGQPSWLSLNGSTFTGTPDQTGEFLITVTASDQGGSGSGLSSSTTFTLKVSEGLTLITPTYECETGHFHFNTAGGDGSLVEFMAIGITGWTTNPSQSLDQELRSAPDAPTITLMARQNGQVVTLNWNVRDVCPLSGARRAAVAEVGRDFNVHVLGYPVQDEVAVEVQGPQNQALRVQLMDAQGRLINQEERSATGAVEQVKFWVGNQPNGILLLRVNTPTQEKTVRLLKR